MLKQYFSNQSKRPQQLTALLVVVIVAGIGTYLLTGSHAATPYASITANKGTLTCGASVVSDPTASDGTSAVQFGSCASGGGGGGGTTGSWWKPSSAHSLSWYWEISNVPATLSYPAQVYDIDGLGANTSGQTLAQQQATITSEVSTLHSQGKKVICYMDAGTSEDFRYDFSSFPSALMGATNGWPGEKWLDVRPSGPDYSQLQQIMTKRFQQCKAEGFDAVEPDNIDSWDGNNPGFPTTASDQATYNKWIATTVHGLGLSVGLKNDGDQTGSANSSDTNAQDNLTPAFDWAIDEQCNQYSECDLFAPFVTAGKAVFNAEYSGSTSTFCPADASAHINGALFALNLDGTKYSPCTQTW